MRQRGHVLLLLMMALAAVLVCTSIFANRLNMDIEARRSTDLRVQALWLARSAVDAGVTGVQQVQTPSGPAFVRVERGPAGTSARVDLSGASALVTTEPAQERFVGAEQDYLGSPGSSSP